MENKPSYDLDYWDADPETIPKHIKEKKKKEEKDYSHMFYKTTPEGSIPHPDRHTIRPEGAVTEMSSSDVIDAFNDAREKGTDIVDI